MSESDDGDGEWESPCSEYASVDVGLNDGGAAGCGLDVCVSGSESEESSGVCGRWNGGGEYGLFEAGSGGGGGSSSASDDESDATPARSQRSW